MSDYICVSCGHGPHKTNPCICGCTNWQNSMLIQARGVININNILMTELPRGLNTLGELLLIVREAFPEATAKVQADLEAEVKKMQEAQDKLKEETQPSEST